MKKLIALVLALVMALSLVACGNGAANEKDKPLVVGYSPFNSKFSPFFSETAYDQDVWTMTQVLLLTSDRTGAIILNGIEGETINYNGTDYTYYGPANLTITENADGTVYYDFVLRDDITFSDGKPLTVDDVIFSMYVLCDPTYDGYSTLYAQPILGLEEYRSGMESRGNVIFAAGPDGYTATDLYTEEQYNTFWDYYNNNAGADFAKEICDYCIANGYSAADDPIEAIAPNWGFELAEGATYQDFWNTIVEAYGGDTEEAESVESAGSTRLSLTIAALGSDYQAGVTTGVSADKIEGIQKTGANSLRVVLTQVDATAIYQLAISIAPLHYYGDTAKYDYENNMFGFDKGDLSPVRAKTTQPMGAGPYKFIKFENGVVNFEANENYFLGAPKTKYINFLQCVADDDKLNGISTGTIDVTDPSMSTEKAEAISQANGGAGLVGDVITTDLVDNLGYGYIGICADRVNVGGVADSDASKNLRKALGTILSVYRDVAIDSYYGELADVINYPISNTSWAAPRSADDGYKVAFSTAVDGSAIYTSGMSAEDKYAAAKEAALGYFKAAGYTVADGKLTAAPEGAALEYEFWIPGDGIGDHPSFMVATMAKEALAEMGFNLIVNDLTNSSALWDALDATEVDMWAAAWQATVDPDMYQIYHSSNRVGIPGATGSNHYCIADDNLDTMIMEARSSTDQTYRKAMYKACLDTIVDWAVEIPVYQRQNAITFSTERVNLDTVTPDITTFYGWLSEVQNIELK